MRELTYRPARGRKREPHRSRSVAPQTAQDRIFLIVLAALFLVGCVWLGVILVQESAAKQDARDLQKDYVSRSGEWLQIDWPGLKKENPDIIAWLDIPDTPISYPVLQGADDNEYLRTTVQHKPNILGSIFVSQYNHAPFTGDDNTLIFGHNSHASTMFGTLKEYRKKEYCQRHLYLFVYFPDGSRKQYRVFSVQETRTGSSVYTLRFSDPAAFRQWRITQSGQSVVPLSVTPGNENPVITLSTCTGGGGNRRTVVIAQQTEGVEEDG